MRRVGLNFERERVGESVKGRGYFHPCKPLLKIHLCTCSCLSCVATRGFVMCFRPTVLKHVVFYFSKLLMIFEVVAFSFHRLISYCLVNIFCQKKLKPKFQL
jgi:hypothetical protein